MHIGLFCKFNQKKGELSTTAPLFNKDGILRSFWRRNSHKQNRYEDWIHQKQDCIQKDLQCVTHIRQTSLCKCIEKEPTNQVQHSLQLVKALTTKQLGKKKKKE